MSHKYALLEEINEDGIARPPRTTSKSKKITAITIGLIATIAFVATAFNAHAIRIATYKSPNCGNSVEEARAKGCHYEPMLRSWIPDACYTSEPSEEFSPFDDRPWYLDRNMTQPMTDHHLDMMKTGENLTGYTLTFHNEHCLYAWRKLHLAVEKRLPLLDSKSMNLAHSTHCSKRMSNLVFNVGFYGYNETLYHTSYAPIMFQTCVPLYW